MSLPTVRTISKRQIKYKEYNKLCIKIKIKINLI
jgi:hypothetical protein